MSKNKYDVFISHSRKYGDNEIANLIYDKLSPYYSVYLDIRTQDMGRFDELLEEYVCNCNDFILIISKNSIENESWVWKEVRWAKENHKNIIPVYVDANNIAKERFPEDLGDISKISWVEYHEKRVDEVIKAIVKYLKTKPNIRKLRIGVGILSWIVAILLSLLGKVNFSDESTVKVIKVFYWEYLVVSFSACLFFRRYFTNLLISIYNLLSILGRNDIGNNKGIYCYWYFYCNKSDEKNTVWKLVKLFCSAMVLWTSIFVLPMARIDLLLNLELFLKVDIVPIVIKTVCVFFSIVFMCIYIKIIFYISDKYWNMNRKHIIITGEGNTQYIRESKELMQWIIHMCQEDAVFYLKRNTNIGEIIYDSLIEMFKCNRNMNITDYVEILDKNTLKDINMVNISEVYHIHFISKDDNNMDKEIRSENNNITFLGNSKNIIVFCTREQTVYDCFGNAVIKSMDQLSNIRQIMENEFLRSN